MRDRASGDAPGRVNLIGEHTDYHQGYVLPTITPQRTHAHVERRPDRRVRASSTAMPGGSFEYELGAEARAHTWGDYVQGVTVVLARHGTDVPGFDVRIESDVPPGAGVSSSAALEVALLRALRTMTGAALDDVTLAKLAQRVETDFVGAPIGIMDQMASSLGAPGVALFIDTRSLATESVPIPETVEIAVIDSGVPHEHARGMYATRRRESFEAAAALGVSWLRDVSLSDLPRIEKLPDPLNRRARHIVTENARVLESVNALRAGDAIRLGALFNASHASMRDDYETSTREVDVLVALAQEHSCVFGARLTGGGFGGAIVMLARSGCAAAAASDVCAAYRATTRRAGRVLIPSAGQ